VGVATTTGVGIGVGVGFGVAVGLGAAVTEATPERSASVSSTARAALPSWVRNEKIIQPRRRSPARTTPGSGTGTIWLNPSEVLLEKLPPPRKVLLASLPL
jgi:hypothetical protein